MTSFCTLNRFFKKFRAYLTFLYIPLKELRRLTKIFQSNRGDNLKVYEELMVSFKSLAAQILKPAVLRENGPEDLCKLELTPFVLLPSDSVDMGTKFANMLEQLKMSPDEKEMMRSRAVDFLLALFKGFQSRLRGTVSLMKRVQKFAMPDFLNSPLDLNSFRPPFFPQDLNMAEVESQFRQMKVREWTAKSTDAFWLEVHSFQDISGDNPFKIISTGEKVYLCRY